MTTTASTESPNSEPPKNPPSSSKARLKKWFHWKRDPPLAVVLENGNSHLVEEEMNDVNRKSTPNKTTYFLHR